MNTKHSFHIPVMGIGFTIDTPIKVAHLGIDSVVSLVDDELIEKMRKFYSQQFKIPYQEIKNTIEDFKAKRITSYLDMLQNLVDTKFSQLKNLSSENTAKLNTYFDLLPSTSLLKKSFVELLQKKPTKETLSQWLNTHLSAGSIDVNIMTKIDKENYIKDEKLPSIYNDAHAALRGFANSKLESSVVLSAGMNPRLYGYIAEFNDFFPTKNGYLKKKLILKVSDYRSALIQSKFLAKKGLWVSEFRIESGLNCGGHAFATDGLLLGPILEQFKAEKSNLTATLHSIYQKALLDKEKAIPANPLPIKFSAQGGVGTSEEHQFLMENYQLDSIGWGSPFLLVPEATTMDIDTRKKLELAREKDIYLSNISPLGIPFNNLRDNSKDQEKIKNINKGRPGSSCSKKYVSLNKDFDDKGLCTASRKYQYSKLKELDAMNLSQALYQEEFNAITSKSCICVGLGTAALLANNLDTKTEGEGVSVCPGPNLAYFSETLSLKEMVAHIYGEISVLDYVERPHMFIKEFEIYLSYLKDKVRELKRSPTEKSIQHLKKFTQNMSDAIVYYKNLFESKKSGYNFSKNKIRAEFDQLQGDLNIIGLYFKV